MEGGGIQRKRSLRKQMSVVDSVILRDFLRVKETENGRNRLAGLTLDAVLSEGKTVPPNRTLFDIIQNEGPNGASYKAYFGRKDKTSWKTFKEKLLHKRSSGSAWKSTLHIPTSDMPIRNARPQSMRLRTAPPNQLGELRHAMDHHQLEARENTLNISAPVSLPKPQITRHNSLHIPSNNCANNETIDDNDEQLIITRPPFVQFQEERILSAREAVAAQEAAEAEVAAVAAAAAEAEDGKEETEDVGAEADAEAEPVRMSLMDLLGETDGQTGLFGSSFIGGESDNEDFEDDEEEEEEGEGVMEHNCCVCMVRHKGAASIPCGHTYCRLCSRELWVSRGNCPLCNDFILEILDVF